MRRTKEKISYPEREGLDTDSAWLFWTGGRGSRKSHDLLGVAATSCALVALNPLPFGLIVRLHFLASLKLRWSNDCWLMRCGWKWYVLLPGLAGKTLSPGIAIASSSPTVTLVTICQRWQSQGWKELGLSLHYHCERSTFVMWSHWDVRVYPCYQLTSPQLIYSGSSYGKTEAGSQNDFWGPSSKPEFNSFWFNGPTKEKSKSRQHKHWASFIVPCEFLYGQSGSSHWRPVVNNFSFLVPSDLAEDPSFCELCMMTILFSRIVLKMT